MRIDVRNLLEQMYGLETMANGSNHPNRSEVLSGVESFCEEHGVTLVSDGAYNELVSMNTEAVEKYVEAKALNERYAICMRNMKDKIEHEEKRSEDLHDDIRDLANAYNDLKDRYNALLDKSLADTPIYASE